MTAKYAFELASLIGDIEDAPTANEISGMLRSLHEDLSDAMSVDHEKRIAKRAWADSSRWAVWYSRRAKDAWQLYESSDFTDKTALKCNTLLELIAAAFRANLIPIEQEINRIEERQQRTTANYGVTSMHNSCDDEDDEA